MLRKHPQLPLTTSRAFVAGPTLIAWMLFFGSAWANLRDHYGDHEYTAVFGICAIMLSFLSTALWAVARIEAIAGGDRGTSDVMNVPDETMGKLYRLDEARRPRPLPAKTS